MRRRLPPPGRGVRDVLGELPFELRPADPPRAARRVGGSASPRPAAMILIPPAAGPVGPGPHDQQTAPSSTLTTTTATAAQPGAEACCLTPSGRAAVAMRVIDRSDGRADPRDSS